MSDQQWFTLDEAGVYLGGISRSTVKRLIAKGKLTVTKPSPGATRLRRSELDRYLRASERGRAA